MVSVAGDAERASSQDRDVVRLRGVRGALPVLRERILVRELRHIGGGTVDVRDVMVLHEDDDELVEVARDLRRHVSRRCDRHGSRDRDEARSEQRDDDQEDRGQGGADGSPHAGPPLCWERASRIATWGGCGQPEGGIRAPAKGTSPDLGRGYMRARSRLSRLVAAMRNSIVGENGKRAENRRKPGGATARTTRFLPLPPLR